MLPMIQVKTKKICKDAKPLRQATDGSAGIDIAYCGEKSVVITNGSRLKLGTGWSFEIPKGIAVLVLPRSGLSTKKGLRPVNTPGLIDSDYRGELFVSLEKTYSEGGTLESQIATIKPGDYIAQLLFVPYVNPQFITTDHLSETERADGGFGSTGN